MTDCNNVPQVAMDFMNKVHCEELEIADKLSDIVKESISLGEVHSEIDTYLESWIKHTVSHFERENNLMKEYKFPAYIMHSQEHEQALRNMKIVEINWKKNRDLKELDSFINSNWRPWFGQHISTMDTMTARFLSQFNISVEL